jgi:hypothetical protein
MSTRTEKTTYVTTNLSLGFTTWLGGAVWVAHQPGQGFWDGVFWLYYVGRFVAQHLTALTLPS